MEHIEKPARAFHLAGIVPVAGKALDFNFPWHDCLQPIAQNYLAVERAVVECAYAGCETIWIVCHDDMQPLIRYRLGEYIQDPVYLFRNMSPGSPDSYRRPIPIYYVPIHPKDKDKRDCLAWSVLYGAMASYYTCKQISKWSAPDRYYTAFPYGVYDPEILRQYRRNISSKEGFYLEHEGKTIKDGEYLGFTFNSDEFKHYRRELRKNATGAKDGTPDKKLPLEKRWSARHFTLDNVFGSAKMDDAKVVELSWYYRIDSWKGLRTYMASEDDIGRPNKNMFSYHEFNKVGEDIND